MSGTGRRRRFGVSAGLLVLAAGWSGKFARLDAATLFIERRVQLGLDARPDRHVDSIEERRHF